MKKYIITTSIYSPSEAIKAFIAKKDWQLIVVGDKKTPHREYEKLDCIYLAPEDQEKINKELSDLIGWNTTCRRSFGFIYAYDQGADIIATVDDDNIPYDNWGEDLLIGKDIAVDIYNADNGYFDPLSVTNNKNIWHRGYPLSLVPTKNNISYLGKQTRKILIQAGLWDGDPDIDAVCRITQKPIVKFNTIQPFSSNQLSPFNSQNTFLHRKVIPYYMMLPYVGRMEDIWGAYIALKQFPDSIAYTKASVYQQRNPHDYMQDMELEMLGYKHTLDFLTSKFILPEKTKTAYELYKNHFQKNAIKVEKLDTAEALI